MKKLISLLLAIALVWGLALGGCKGKAKAPAEPNKAASPSRTAPATK